MRDGRQMPEAAKSKDTRSCTCHPDEAPTPCRRKYASRDCKLADIAERIRYAADMVGDDELPHQLYGLAREIEDVVG